MERCKETRSTEGGSLNPVACLTMTKQIDESFTWVAYDAHGARLLVQDDCEDIYHCMEESLKAIVTLEPVADRKAPAQQFPPAGKPPRRRNGKK